MTDFEDQVRRELATATQEVEVSAELWRATQARMSRRRMVRRAVPVTAVCLLLAGFALVAVPAFVDQADVRFDRVPAEHGENSSGGGGEEAGGDRAGEAAAARWRELPSPPAGRWQAPQAFSAGGRVHVWEPGEGAATLDLSQPADRAWQPWSPHPVEGAWADAAAWTGGRLVVCCHPQDGGLAAAVYDPGQDSWEVTATAPLQAWAGEDDAEEPARTDATATWTGEEVIVFGGRDQKGRALGDAAAYDPARNAWRSLAQPPVSARWGHGAVWTGEELLVWGGNHETAGHPLHGAAYDPDTGQWRLIASGGPAAFDQFSSVWTGQQLLVWGGNHPEGSKDDGGAYDPATDSWRQVAAGPLSARQQHTAVWTGEHMLVWGGMGYDADRLGGGSDQNTAYVPEVYADGASYDPATDSWQTLPDAVLSPRCDHAAVWTGQEMVIVGARGCASAETGGEPEDQRTADAAALGL